MFSFFKHIFNTIIIIFAIIGVVHFCNNDFIRGMSDGVTNIFSINKDKIEAEVGDFSHVDDEFNIDKAIKVVGYKTVVAKHPSSGQKMIIVDSGKKTLLTADDINSDRIKEKLEDICKRFKYHSATVDKIEITDRGYMTAYGQRVPYVKFNAKISNLPRSNVSGIVSAVNNDKDNQRLIISLNDKKHYSQLITSEFYRNVKESKSGK